QLQPTHPSLTHQHLSMTISSAAGPIALHTSIVTSPPLLFKAPPTTHLHTLSLHAALPISRAPEQPAPAPPATTPPAAAPPAPGRSEENTSELQSRVELVCRLLLEKKNNSCTIRVTCRTLHGVDGETTPCV